MNTLIQLVKILKLLIYVIENDSNQIINCL